MNNDKMITNTRKLADMSLMNRLLSLTKDATLYGSAKALNKAFGLIIFPLLARNFSVSEYGLIDLFTVTARLLTIMFIFGQDSAVDRFFFRHEKIEDRIQIVSQSLLFQFAFMIIFIPLLWYFSEIISARLIVADEAEIIFKIVLLKIPCLLFYNFALNLLRITFS